MDKNKLSEIIKNKLDEKCDELSEQYFSADNKTTSRYFTLDNVLPDDLCLEIYNNFPHKDIYYYRDDFRERKLTFKKLHSLKNPIVNAITDAFQMDNVIHAVEKITKLKNLSNDPSLYAGGISRMDMGHFLNPHIDNSHDSDRRRYRRFNLLFYVTPNIHVHDGGNFELWDKEVKHPLKIESTFNRLVVLETTKYSYHSVDPVLSNIQRCTVSNYYFSEESPENHDYYHATSFTGRPEEKFKRFYGPINNFLRNSFVKVTGISRNRKTVRSQEE